MPNYIDAITGKEISSPADSTKAKAAGNPVTEIPNPEPPSLPTEEDSQTEDIDNG